MGDEIFACGRVPEVECGYLLDCDAIWLEGAELSSHRSMEMCIISRLNDSPSFLVKNLSR
jgi:hypothetical protein